MTYGEQSLQCEDDFHSGINSYNDLMFYLNVPCTTARRPKRTITRVLRDTETPFCLLALLKI
jgi:hypothetical protein